MKKYQGIIFYDFLFKKSIFGQNPAGAKELMVRSSKMASPHHTRSHHAVEQFFSRKSE
jgi:hypothetical protein